MWIAKNSLTGKTYGKKFDSIYDCQKYIDEELIILQYEWTSLARLEERFDDNMDYQKWLEKKYPNSKSIVTEIYYRIEYGISLMMQGRSFDGSKGQHVIRCWYVEQKRFADGFDF